LDLAPNRGFRNIYQKKVKFEMDFEESITVKGRRMFLAAE
jgi:hypothetical protein